MWFILRPSNASQLLEITVQDCASAVFTAEMENETRKKSGAIQHRTPGVYRTLT
jgi:hypothetical protein